MTVFVESLMFYHGSIKFSIKVSAKISLRFSWKQNLIKFYGDVGVTFTSPDRDRFPDVNDT